MCLLEGIFFIYFLPFLLRFSLCSYSLSTLSDHDMCAAVCTETRRSNADQINVSLILFILFEFSV